MNEPTLDSTAGIHDKNRGCFRRPILVLSFHVIVSVDSSRLRDRSIVFFKPKPNLPDAEKARIDFHFQQIAECIGFDRFRLPVLSRKTLLEQFESKQTPPQMIRFVGDHLDHDTTELQFSVVPQQAASCSGGG
jgi:hypothetical protein